MQEKHEQYHENLKMLIWNKIQLSHHWITLYEKDATKMKDSQDFSQFPYRWNKKM